MGVHRARLLRVHAEQQHDVHLCVLVAEPGLTADASFATSSYSKHTIVATISVVTAIMNGVSQPFIAKVRIVAFSSAR